MEKVGLYILFLSDFDRCTSSLDDTAGFFNSLDECKRFIENETMDENSDDYIYFIDEAYAVDISTGNVISFEVKDERIDDHRVETDEDGDLEEIEEEIHVREVMSIQEPEEWDTSRYAGRSVAAIQKYQLSLLASEAAINSKNKRRAL